MLAKERYFTVSHTFRLIDVTTSYSTQLSSFFRPIQILLFPGNVSLAHLAPFLLVAQAPMERNAKEMPSWPKVWKSPLVVQAK